MSLILPKTFVELQEGHGPLFFLAGPVRGGGNWQVHMARLLAGMVPGCIIAVPCRWGCLNQLFQYRMAGKEEYFDRQLSWERYYIEGAARARRPGCLIFWLACESKTEPHPGPEPYGMDTRGEIARWSAHLSHDEHVRMVVGAEPKFLGLSQISRNLSGDVGYAFPIYASMEETARQAAEKVRHIAQEPA